MCVCGLSVAVEAPGNSDFPLDCCQTLLGLQGEKHGIAAVQALRLYAACVYASLSVDVSAYVSLHEHWQGFLPGITLTYDLTLQTRSVLTEVYS